MRTAIISASIFLQVSSLPLCAQFEQPYHWGHSATEEAVTVHVDIPENAYLYADRTSVSVKGAGGKTILPESVPQASPHTDEFGTADILEGGQRHQWSFPLLNRAADTITVEYQGCGIPEDGGGALCYPPAQKIISLGNTEKEGKSETKTEKETHGTVLSTELLDSFETVKVAGGMMNPAKFLDFLDMKAAGTPADTVLAGKNTWLVIALVVLGGLALNLTPCVLPMIPINLSIIGAGAHAASRVQGFLRGGVYGSGMALAYGGLGIFAVLTGAKFGSLNSVWWFNFTVGIIFVILSLAMFDVFTIDFTRFSSRFGITGKADVGRLIPAFLMGMVAALLAGACVAPIVIAVLLHSATLYSGGHFFSLFLPLLLGVGMALPWPVVGAGLTVLPKPGAWMMHVKHGFGAVLILLALYYGYLGVKLMPASKAEYSSTDEAVTELNAGLAKALNSDRPAFIDFRASWCKNCLKMEATTLQDPEVIERLRDFVEIKFDAENPNAPRIKAVMDRYGLVGLPGYVLLTPRTTAP